MTNAIDRIYSDSKDLYDFLMESNQISLASSIQDIYRKSLLLSIASYFETQLSSVVLDYAKEVAGEGHIIVLLVKSKAVTRQYHSWFDWNSKNANSFFALFGEDFKAYAINSIKNNLELEQSIKDFLNLGADRNRLVHQDYANFPLEKTSEEIYRSYQSACYFVVWFTQIVRDYSNSSSLPGNG